MYEDLVETFCYDNYNWLRLKN